MRLLRARLLEEEERKRAEELAAERGEQKASTGARRSAATCCTPTSASRTTAPGTRWATPQRVLDGDLDGFVREYLNQAAGTASDGVRVSVGISESFDPFEAFSMPPARPGDWRRRATSP